MREGQGDSLILRTPIGAKNMVLLYGLRMEQMLSTDVPQKN